MTCWISPFHCHFFSSDPPCHAGFPHGATTLADKTVSDCKPHHIYHSTAQWLCMSAPAANCFSNRNSKCKATRKQDSLSFSQQIPSSTVLVKVASLLLLDLLCRHICSTGKKRTAKTDLMLESTVNPFPAKQFVLLVKTLSNKC